MEHSYIQITDLPDELLIMIFKKLNNMQVLQSVLDANIRFNKIARDSTFTSRLTLFRWSSDNFIYPLADSILDRFIIQIIPQVHHNVKWLGIESSSLQRILLAAKYPNLNGLVIFNISEEITRRLFTEENQLTHIFKNQITRLVISICDSKKDYWTDEEQISVFTRMLNAFSNIRDLKLYSPSNLCVDRLSFKNHRPTFFSSTLLEFHVHVQSFSDCLYLLDGRFNQLHTLIVTIDWILTSQPMNNNREELPNLTCFSLTVLSNVHFYDQSVLPLLRRMTNLRKLALYIAVDYYEKFIDGNDLKKTIINHLPRLNEFVFNIRSIIYPNDDIHLLTNEQIQNTFTSFVRNKIISCVDYFPKKKTGRCHIYSHPYTMKYYHDITNNFPGGLFKCVCEVSLFDEQPFEHDFFLRISQSFPFMERLTLSNFKSQKYKHTKSTNDIKDCSIIEYHHLTKLVLLDVNLDYVEQFLDKTKTSFTNNIFLTIKSYLLGKGTNYFTRSELRVNCAKVYGLNIFGELKTRKNLNAYFPNVNKIQFSCC
ncbi:unnamed protein product [Rotaria socialis]|uniref:F-box domain-containing protein n=1 Tax=Rotaria socialis TaxID=392032 RepID=A0A820Y801_9BILA|nr:unnamed protein product [Rotaria socialis]CAF4540636.1 unnamed protein product [Rotaria socialis]